MIFNKNKAVVIDRMNRLSKVVITDEKVTFNIGYSDRTFNVEEIPGFVSDFIQIYGIVKESIDRKTEEENKNKEEDKPELDLSDIPF